MGETRRKTKAERLAEFTASRRGAFADLTETWPKISSAPSCKEPVSQELNPQFSGDPSPNLPRAPPLVWSFICFSLDDLRFLSHAPVNAGEGKRNADHGFRDDPSRLRAVLRILPGAFFGASCKLQKLFKISRARPASKTWFRARLGLRPLRRENKLQQTG
jgi:hypothetical protein